MTLNKIKHLSAAFGVAASIATPALASTPHKPKAKVSPEHASSQTYRAQDMTGWEGQPLGTDPDPNIRFQLLRDQNIGGD